MGVKFNASKCQIMQFHRPAKPLERFYMQNKQALTQVDQAKCLRVMITGNVNWNPHINSIIITLNRCLGLIKRNISNFPKELRKLAYLSLVMSQLEYACFALDPYQIKNISNLEKVQR